MLGFILVVCLSPICTPYYCLSFTFLTVVVEFCHSNKRQALLVRWPQPYLTFTFDLGISWFTYNTSLPLLLAITVFPFGEVCPWKQIATRLPRV